MAVSIYTITTLNVNGLILQSKEGIAELIQKNKTHIGTAYKKVSLKHIIKLLFSVEQGAYMHPYGQVKFPRYLESEKCVFTHGTCS